MVLDSRGNEIKVGDTVTIEKGKTSGVVTHVLEGPFDLKSWGVEESGIMIESKHFGLLFLPVSSFVDDDVQIISERDVANGDKPI